MRLRLIKGDTGGLHHQRAPGGNGSALRVGERDAYYGHEHWFENFPDSPWLSGVFCWKHGKSGSKESSGSRWFGLQCYSPKCAEPVTASFSCGNNTLTAKNF